MGDLSFDSLVDLDAVTQYQPVIYLDGGHVGRKVNLVTQQQAVCSLDSYRLVNCNGVPEDQPVGDDNLGSLIDDDCVA